MIKNYCKLGKFWKIACQATILPKFILTIFCAIMLNSIVQNDDEQHVGD